MKPGRCLIQCVIHSGCALHVRTQLSLSYTGTIVTVVGAEPCPFATPRWCSEQTLGKQRGNLGRLPPSPAGPAAVSTALPTLGARVQRRPASLPDSWKSSISALRPPPFFYHIFFLLDNEASRDQWRSEPRYGSPGRPASIRAGGPGTWTGVGVGRRRVGD